MDGIVKKFRFIHRINHWHSIGIYYVNLNAKNIYEKHFFFHGRAGKSTNVQLSYLQPNLLSTINI